MEQKSQNHWLLIADFQYKSNTFRGGMLLALKEKKQFEETSSDICQFLLVEKCLLS